MNAVSPIAPALMTISTMDLTALALEAQRIGWMTDRRKQMTPAEQDQESRDLRFSYSLEDAVLAGTPTKDSDCLAQLVLLTNRARLIAGNPAEEVSERVDEVAAGLERVIVALSRIMRIDVLELGARSYFYPDALRALGFTHPDQEAGT